MGSIMDWALRTVLGSAEESEVWRAKLVHCLLDALYLVGRQQCESLYIMSA